MTEKSKFMLKAIELSIQSAKTNGGPLGCVIVKINNIIAEGFNLVTANKDGTQADGKIIPQTINHIEMIPILWSALQETIKKVEDLEERVKTLESS